MIGQNRIILNSATMYEAVQLWLDKNLVEPPIVISIREEKDGVCQTFVILVESKKLEVSNVSS